MSEMTIYNTIGHGYARTRAPDARIADQLVALLGLPVGATILDVGAGTGKYSRALAERGYSVIALEPSAVMQAQGEPHPGVRSVLGSAEAIPLPDDSVDGVIVVLAVHHFADRPAAFREMVRVVGDGPVVLFTFDPAAFDQFWLSDYFPEIGHKFRSSKSALSHIATEVQQVTARNVRVVPFPLPPDLQDGFGAAYWARPEAYLKPEVRNGISDFALMNQCELEDGLERLEADLVSGRWDSTYGALREQDSYEVGYRWIIAEAQRK
jgi:ubiquinone/menaquinone biosynthesis C-methylase UbiE